MQSDVVVIDEPSTSTTPAPVTSENEDLIKKILSGQEDVLRTVKKMENVRRKTQSCQKQYKVLEQEIALIVDEREYAYTSVWTEAITRESQCEPWFYERIHTLDRQLRQKTRQYNTLCDFMKQAQKEKKLPSSFQQPRIVLKRLHKLEADLEEARRLKSHILVAKKAEEESERNVREYREDLNLLTDRVHSAVRETTDLRGSVRKMERELGKLVGELRDKYNHVVLVDGRGVWRIVHKDQVPRPVEASPDPISDTEMEEFVEADDTGLVDISGETDDNVEGMEGVEEKKAVAEASETADETKEEKEGTVEATATEDSVKEEEVPGEKGVQEESQEAISDDDDLVEVKDEDEEGSTGGQ